MWLIQGEEQGQCAHGPFVSVTAPRHQYLTRMTSLYRRDSGMRSICSPAET